MDDAFWSVSDVEWPGMTKSHRTRCRGRTWPKGPRKRKTRFVRFHEDPCDHVNDEANDLKFLGSHDRSDMNHIGNVKGWTRITAIMDSGASESVAPLDFAKNIFLKDSEGSRVPWSRLR